MCHVMPKSKNNKNRGKNCATKTKINEYSSQSNGVRKIFPCSCCYMLNHVIFNSPPQDLTFRTLIPREEKIPNKQKLKTQRLKMFTPGETFIISTALFFTQYQNSQESVKSPPAVTFPKGKSPNHPKIRHVQVANNQVRIPQEKRGNIKMPARRQAALGHIRVETRPRLSQI